MMLIGCLTAYSLLIGVLLAVVCVPGWKKYYVQAKTVSSLAFLAVLVLAPAGCGQMLPAFLCCFAGDVMMAVYNLHRRKKYFLAGLFLFLAGHVCFVIWLAGIQPMAAVEFLFPAAAVLFIFGLTSLKQIHTGRLRPFILLYAFFVALFFSKAAHLFWSGFSIPNAVIAGGAMLFAMSDISILFLYFSRKKGNAIHVFNLATYYAGMFLLASSLYFY
jgi:uncharacterized membrane protein YhhN